MSTQRIITVVATKGGRIEKLTTDVSTWGDLKMLIQDKYDLGNLKAVENVGKTTLEHPDAVLPTGDFRLFLRPSKTKSGGNPDFASMSFGDMKEFIKNNEDAKNYLNEEAKKSGRNWTQLKTEERRAFLTKFYASNGAAKPTEPQVEEVQATEEVVETSTNQVVELNPLQKFQQAKKLIEDAVCEIEHVSDFDEIDEISQETISELDSIIDLLKNDYDADEVTSTTATASTPKVESEADKKAREEREEAARKAEAERLEREEILREGNDIFDDM